MKEFKLFSHLITLKTVNSTNDYAVELIRNVNPAEGTVILADYQEKGRGQKGNHWISEKSKNLTFSIIIFPSFLIAEKQFYISMSLSLGVLDFLDKFFDNAYIKWPNDIFIGKKKIAGILIENSLAGNQIKSSVLGIGLNVNQLIFGEIRPEPTSFALEFNKEFDRNYIMKELLKSIEYFLTRLYDKKFSETKSIYESRLLFINEWIELSDVKGDFAGMIKGINEIGQLMVHRKDGSLQTYNFKEISFNI